MKELGVEFGVIYFEVLFLLDFKTMFEKGEVKVEELKFLELYCLDVRKVVEFYSFG